MSLKFFVLLFITLLFFVSCGKSPLQLEKKTMESSGENNIEVTKKFKTLDQTIELFWLRPRNTLEAGRFLLISKKNKVAYDLPENFKIILWMPSMGHGSSPVLINKIGTGVYDVSEVYFIMDKDWQIKVQLIEGANILEEVNFDYYI